MAARNRTWTPEIVRQRIRTSMLVNRLQDHVAGKVELTPTQVSAALGLLRKTAPDMTSAAVTVTHRKRKSYAQRVKDPAPAPEVSAGSTVEHTVQ